MYTENTVKATMGERLRVARECAGLTQKRVAELLNASKKAPLTTPGKELLQGTYIGWENGRNKVDIEWIPALCDVLGVDVGYLFGEYPEKTRVAADVCGVTGLKQETVEFLREQHSGQLVKDGFFPPDRFSRVVDFLITDAQYNGGDYGPLLKMISVYMGLDSGENKSVYTLNTDGEIKKARSYVGPDEKRHIQIPSNAVAFDSDMLDAVALAAISQKLTAMKRQQKKDG